jgi:hypothetical protein
MSGQLTQPEKVDHVQNFLPENLAIQPPNAYLAVT